MIRNFLFHRVNPTRDLVWDPMDVKLFERCIRFISLKYKVVLFEHIAFNEMVLNTKDIYATIMFDDGYKDNVEYALPILEKYGVKASFYVVTDCIDLNIPTWTYRLDYAFQNTKKRKISLDFSCLPEKLKYGEFDSPKARNHFVKELKPFLKSLGDNERNEILENVYQIFGDVEPPQIMMTWEDLKHLHSLGHYVGSHTVTHSMLGTIEDAEKLENELYDSGKRIKEKLGYFPLTISYPVGSYNDLTIKVSKEVGYKIGLAVKQDVFDSKNDTIFEVSRIELYNESWMKTKLRISNRLEDVKKLIGYR